jgi:threonine dehydratase
MPPTATDLERAERVVREHLLPTPLVRVELGKGVAATLADAEVWLKLDTLQPTGSFKVRGALAAIAAYRDSGVEHGFIAASAGNHALALVYAARRLGVRARVVVAETASPVKIAALRAMGADLIIHGDGYDAAEAHAIELAERDRMTYVSAYNDPHVIAGQATLAGEVAEQIGDAMTVVVPVGGGGLIAGTCLRFADRADVEIVGVETAVSLAFSAALRSGEVAAVPVGPTLADGLAGNLEPGCITPSLAAPRIERLVSVDEDQIRTAIRALCQQAGLIAEGAGAVGVAALLAGKIRFRQRVVIACTGRNIPARALVDIIGDECAS